jgi:hypothetical protein
MGTALHAVPKSTMLATEGECAAGVALAMVLEDMTDIIDKLTVVAARVVTRLG